MDHDHFTWKTSAAGGRQRKQTGIKARTWFDGGDSTDSDEYDGVPGMRFVLYKKRMLEQAAAGRVIEDPLTWPPQVDAHGDEVKILWQRRMEMMPAQHSSLCESESESGVGMSSSITSWQGDLSKELMLPLGNGASLSDCESESSSESNTSSSGESDVSTAPTPHDYQPNAIVNASTLNSPMGPSKLMIRPESIMASGSDQASSLDLRDLPYNTSLLSHNNCNQNVMIESEFNLYLDRITDDELDCHSAEGSITQSSLTSPSNFESDTDSSCSDRHCPIHPRGPQSHSPTPSELFSLLNTTTFYNNNTSDSKMFWDTISLPLSALISSEDSDSSDSSVCSSSKICQNRILSRKPLIPTNNSPEAISRNDPLPKSDLVSSVRHISQADFENPHLNSDNYFSARHNRNIAQKSAILWSDVNLHKKPLNISINSHADREYFEQDLIHDMNNQIQNSHIRYHSKVSRSTVNYDSPRCIYSTAQINMANNNEYIVTSDTDKDRSHDIGTMAETANTVINFIDCKNMLAPECTWKCKNQNLKQMHSSTTSLPNLDHSHTSEFLSIAIPRSISYCKSFCHSSLKQLPHHHKISAERIRIGSGRTERSRSRSAPGRSQSCANLDLSASLSTCNQSTHPNHSRAASCSSWLSHHLSQCNSGTLSDILIESQSHAVTSVSIPESLAPKPHSQPALGFTMTDHKSSSDSSYYTCNSRSCSDLSVGSSSNLRNEDVFRNGYILHSRQVTRSGCISPTGSTTSWSSTTEHEPMPESQTKLSKRSARKPLTWSDIDMGLTGSDEDDVRSDVSDPISVAEMFLSPDYPGDWINFYRPHKTAMLGYAFPDIDEPDFTVYAGNRSFPCYLVVLSFYSTYFKRAWTTNEVTLPSDEISMDAFDAILKWMVCDNREKCRALELKDVSDVRHACRYLGVALLEQMCVDVLLSNKGPDAANYMEDVLKWASCSDMK